MKKIATLLTLILLSSSFLLKSSTNENEKLKFDSRNLVYGGGINFGFGKDYWSVGVFPRLGYQINSKLVVGAGVGYRYGKRTGDIYVSVDDIWYTEKYKWIENSAHLNLFVNYFPWKKLIFTAEPELINTWYTERYGSVKNSLSKLTPAFTVGGGVYLKPITIQLKYELIQHKYSPYSDNVYLSFGLFFK